MTAQKQLELQSDRIEMVLINHKAPARVTGGIITPRVVQFHLTPAAGTRINKVRSLANELALALGVANVRISRQGSNVQLEVQRDDARPIKLLSLMARCGLHAGSGLGQTPSTTAILGMCDDGTPLLLRLSSPDVAHVLISGATGSGKTALCQAMILSLAMTHRRSQLQFVLVDPKQRPFAPFATLPHLLWPIIGDAASAADALGQVVRLMETRACPERSEGGQGDKGAKGRGDKETREQGEITPRVVVVLDELADLIQRGGKTLVGHLTRLTQRGRGAGIHVVACTQKPSSQVMGTLMRANFPTRLVGKVVSPEDARVAAGIGGTGAEKLAGRGDFIAVAAGQVLRFQAAYVSPAEMAQVVAQLGSAPRRWDVIQRRPSLLRQAVALMAGTS